MCIIGKPKFTKMAPYEEAYQKFTEEMNALDYNYHEESYHAVMKYLGSSVLDKYAALVACSDPKELDYIKKHFWIGKLGLNEDDERLDSAIQQVCHALGESNNKKHRPTFYYLLIAILKEDFNKLN